MVHRFIDTGSNVTRGESNPTSVVIGLRDREGGRKAFAVQGHIHFIVKNASLEKGAPGMAYTLGGES